MAETTQEAMNTTEQHTSQLIYKNEPISELDAINLVKDGTKIEEFNFPTTLMLFTAVNYQKDGWKSVPDQMRWGKRLAKLAVSKDYQAIKVIPDQIKPACAFEFANSELMQSRKTIKDWQETFLQMDEKFIRKVVNLRPSLNKYIPDDRESLKTSLIIPAEKKKPLRLTIAKEQNEYEMIGEDEALGGEVLTGMTGEEYLALPREQKTEELLDKVISAKRPLPEDFIKTLILPNRNAFFYQKKGDMARFEAEKKEILPFITKGKCTLIARVHPEASLGTPQFLDNTHLGSFWKKTKATNPEKLYRYFMKLPKENLTVNMLYDIKVDADIINHAPDLFTTEEGRVILEKFLDKNAYAVMYLPEQFQYVKYLVKDGVTLDRRTIRHIKNKDLRKKVQIALKIR